MGTRLKGVASENKARPSSKSRSQGNSSSLITDEKDKEEGEKKPAKQNKTKKNKEKQPRGRSNRDIAKREIRRIANGANPPAVLKNTALHRWCTQVLRDMKLDGISAIAQGRLKAAVQSFLVETLRGALAVVQRGNAVTPHVPDFYFVLKLTKCQCVPADEFLKGVAIQPEKKVRKLPDKVLAARKKTRARNDEIREKHREEAKRRRKNGQTFTAEEMRQYRDQLKPKSRPKSRPKPESEPESETESETKPKVPGGRRSLSGEQKSTT